MADPVSLMVVPKDIHMYDRIEAAGANAKFTVNGVAPSKKLAKIAQLIVKKYGAHVRQEGLVLIAAETSADAPRRTVAAAECATLTVGELAGALASADGVLRLYWSDGSAPAAPVAAPPPARAPAAAAPTPAPATARWRKSSKAASSRWRPRPR